jgi:hypothetical protein
MVVSQRRKRRIYKNQPSDFTGCAGFCFFVLLSTVF